MADSFKHIEEHFKKSMQDYTISNSAASTAGFASVMAAANKKLFFKFMPKRFNIYYLSAAITVSSATTATIMVNNSKEPDIINANEIVVDTANVESKINLENTAIYSDSLKNEPEATSKNIETEVVNTNTVTADTINLTPPENPVVSTSKKIIPETIETTAEPIEESSVENHEPVQEPESKEPEVQTELKNTNITTETKPVQVDSTIVIEKEDVLIKNSEIQVKKQTVKKKGR